MFDYSGWVFKVSNANPLFFPPVSWRTGQCGVIGDLEYLRNGKISTGQIPPPEAIRLDRMSTHSSASMIIGSSVEVTR